MLLRSLHVTNFLSHRSTEVDLHPVTVFVGPCNSGKSAVFDGLLNLAQLASGRISQAFSAGPWSYASTLHRRAAPNGQIAFSAHFDTSSIQYEVAYRENRLSQYADPTYELISETLARSGVSLFNRAHAKYSTELAALRPFVTSDAGILHAVRTARIQGLPADVSAVARNVSRIVKYRLEPSNLRRVGDVDFETRPRLRARGERLASLLFYAEQHGTLSDLAEVLSRVIVGFEGFEFNTTREQEVGFSLRFRDGRGRVAAARLSDGTLHFLGLAALLVLGGDDLPELVCLEEPEVGLNSSAMRELVRLIYETSKNRRCQILVSTHSPYLLAELWNRATGNPFDLVKYVTIDQKGEDTGASYVRPMSALAANPRIRREIDVRTAAELLDGTVS